MKVLFDTNVVLDVLLDRRPFSAPAASLFAKVETGEIEGSICATTVTTIHYIAAKAVGTQQARVEVKKIMALFEIAPVNRTVLETAITAKFLDFEDSVIHEAARHIGAQAIVTRNPKDFKGAVLAIYTPQELEAIFNRHLTDR
ncbi:MAG: PIN domain-containing protein [Deltaproteobacteria bacterium]|nr:PIN domain-containing protein [Deltaproteobacteria bacterium]